MSNHDWESAMSSEFDARVRDLHEAPLTLDSVRGRATRIRRTRRLVTAGGVLAAAAVVVPIGILAAGAGDDGPDRPPVATDSSSPTRAPAPTDPGAIGVGYLEGATYHRADGTAFELPAATYQSATTLGERVLASRNDDETGMRTVELIDAGGAVVDSVAAFSDPVTSASGVAAFIDTEGDLRAFWDGGDATIDADFADNSFVVAVTGSGSCEAGSDCRFFVNDGDGDPPVVVDADGSVSEVAPGVLGVGDATDEGLVSVVNDYPDDYSACGGVYDEAAGDYRFEGCFQLEDISPDGQHVVAVPAETEGFGAGSVSILDMSGSVVASFEPEDGAIPGRIVWQDDGHAVVPVFTYGTSRWTIVRLAVDGSTEVVVGPTPGEDVDAPFLLTD